jgi:hypothetical protein
MESKNLISTLFLGEPLIAPPSNNFDFDVNVTSKSKLAIVQTSLLFQ